jgi:hypothetical protein
MGLFFFSFLEYKQHPGFLKVGFYHWSRPVLEIDSWLKIFCERLLISTKNQSIYVVSVYMLRVYVVFDSFWLWEIRRFKYRDGRWDPRDRGRGMVPKPGDFTQE